MRFPVKKFFSYYKPYLTLFLSVLACTFIVSAVTLVFPLLVRYITKDVLEGDLSTALSEVYWIGGLMLVLVAIQNIGNYFVDYKGHEIGARMESDMRSELFAHMQKLSFTFYDKEKTGQLMSRITNKPVAPFRAVSSRTRRLPQIFSPLYWSICHFVLY